jgi:hypothetical protein
MRILYISGSANKEDICGVGQYVYNLFHESKFFLNKNQYFLITDSLKSINEFNNIYFIKNWRISNIKRVFTFIKSVKPEIIHIHYYSLSFRKYILPLLIPIILKLFYKNQLVVTFHENFFNKIITSIALLPVFLLSDKIITPHPALHGNSKYFKIILDKYDNKIHILNSVPNIKPNKIIDYNKEFNKNIKFNEINIAIYGIISERKKILDLINYFNIKSFNINIFIIGSFSNITYQKKFKHDLDIIKNSIYSNINIKTYYNIDEVLISELLYACDIALFNMDNRSLKSSTTVITSIVHNLIILYFSLIIDEDFFNCPFIYRINNLNEKFNEDIFHLLFNSKNKSNTMSVYTWDFFWRAHILKLNKIYNL